MNSSKIGFALSVLAGSLAFAAFASLAACSSVPPAKQQIDDVKTRAAQSSDAGNSYFRQGQYAQALRMFQDSLDLNLSVDNREGAVLSYSSIGKALLATGDTAGARKAFQNAHSISDDLKDQTLITRSQLNIAELYLKLGGQATDATADENNAHAISILEQLTAGITAKSNEDDTAVIYHDLGTAYARKARFSDAIDYLKRALALNEKLKRVPEQAANHYMLASVYSRENQFIEASTEIETALALDKKWENSPGIGEDLYAAGKIAERAGEREKAYGFYSRSLSVFLAIDSVAGARRAVESLATTARALQKNDDAVGYEKMLRDINAAGSAAGSTAGAK